MKLIRWTMGKIRHIVAENEGGDEIAPDGSLELYAYSTVAFYKEGGWSNIAGFVHAESHDAAQGCALRTTRRLSKDKGDILDYSVHSHRLDPIILSDIKRHYGLVDKYERLEDTDELG